MNSTTRRVAATALAALAVTDALVQIADRHQVTTRTVSNNVATVRGRRRTPAPARPADRRGDHARPHQSTTTY